MARISVPFMCLIFTVMYHNLQCYETGEYVGSVDFNFHSANGKHGFLGSHRVTLTTQLGPYTRLLRQWKKFPTSIQEDLLNVIWTQIVKKSQKVGRGVRWEQENAYDVDEEELSMYGTQLRADLQRAEKDNLIPDMLNPDDCAMEKESSDKESVQPKRINAIGGDNGDEQSVGEERLEIDGEEEQRDGEEDGGEGGNREEDEED